MIRGFYLKLLVVVGCFIGPSALLAAYQLAKVYGQIDPTMQGAASLALVIFCGVGVITSWWFVIQPVGEWLGSKRGPKNRD